MLAIFKRSLGLALGLGLAGIGSLAWAAPTTAQPGALNYIEGQARIGDQTLSSKSVGSAVLNSGDVLTTGNGRAELLLTPGVYMRVGKNSAVRMDSPELMNTRVEVLQGEAMVEADLLHKEDHVLIAERGAITEVQKKGIYDFDADNGTVRVYDGKAEVNAGDQHTEVGKGKQVLVSQSQPLKAQKFDRDSAATNDPLYSWSKLRSEYLAEATAASAQTYIVNTGGWYGPGWYWNPWWGMYSFVPGDGFFYGPFGFGLYSPAFIYRNPVYYPGFYRAGVVTARQPVVGSAPAFRSAAPAFRSAPIGGMRSMSMGGGFHGHR
jgi:hypothetical protein